MVAIDIYVVETMDDCHNAGPCCMTCPNYDQCEQHWDEDEEG